MKILLVKMSSMGDVIHTLPAVTDALRNKPDLEIHWLVEEAFQEIPAWHPAVKKVIPLAFRRLRKNPIKMFFSKEWKSFKKQVNTEQYDLVIDAQGLLKSAFIAKQAKGAAIAGFDKNSAREPLASRAYQYAYSSDKNQHAVERTRELFAKALDYEKPAEIGEFGLEQKFVAENRALPDGCCLPEKFVFFIHATTWPSKHWPELYWKDLAAKITGKGYSVCIPWINDIEKKRAENIAQGNDKIIVLPKLNLEQIATVIKNAKAAVAVDTGLGHLTAALNVPAISLYGPTSPTRVGAYGKDQKYLEAKDFLQVDVNQKPLTEKVQNQPASGQQAKTKEPALFGEIESTADIKPKEMAPIKPQKVFSELELLLQGQNQESSL